MPWHEYPYSQYYSDIDRMCGMCKKLGYRLEVQGDYLRLVNHKNEVVSSVKIHYAEVAELDTSGRPIKAYIADAGTGETTLLFTRGDGEIITLTVPFSETAAADQYGNDLSKYIKNIQVSGDKLQIVRGDATSFEVEVPYAVKASTSDSGRNIDTFACSLAVDGRQLVLSDALGRELARVTPSYAQMAEFDVDGDAIKNDYAHSLTTGQTTVKLIAKDGTQLSEITVPFATASTTDEVGLPFRTSYANSMVIDGDGKRIGLNSPTGNRLSTITVPFATESTDAANAIETVAVVGDNIVFTTYAGQSYSVQAPFALKSQKDDLGNDLKHTYVASVTNDAQTGALEFRDATGAIICTLTPTVLSATTDNYGNLLGDYIKSLVVSNQSNYVLATHGDGTVDSLIINYANRAWKDTLDHPIQNYYVSWLTCEEDVDDGHYKLVMWNGDNPRAEIGRLELTAYSAQTDINGRDLITYVGNIEVISNKITVSDGAGNIFEEIVGEVDLSNLGATFAGNPLTPTGTVSGTAVTLTAGTLPSCSYDATTQTLTFSAGAFPAVDTVTDPSFTGDAVTPTGTVTITGGVVPVDFDD